MNKVTTAARILLGLLFTVFGLDYFFHFLPPLGEPSQPGMAFLESLFATGYMFPLVKGLEVVAGLMLLSGRFVPLAVALLAPIVLNIVLYHLFLDSNGLLIALAAGLLEIVVAWGYRDAFKPFLQLRAQPA